MFIERAVRCEAVEQVALLLAIGREVSRPPGIGMDLRPFESEFQKPQLQGVDALIFHIARGAQLTDFLLNRGTTPQLLRLGRLLKTFDRFKIQVDEVPIKNAVRKIGAGVIWLTVVNGVKRVQGQEADANLAGGPVARGAQIAKIAAAPVVPGAEAVKRDGDAGGAAPFLQETRQVGSIRRDDQAHRGAWQIRKRNAQGMIAER